MQDCFLKKSLAVSLCINYPSMHILILNGPNLNLIGKREPDIYGHKTYEQLMTELTAAFPEVQLTYLQSNIEGELITMLQQADESNEAVVFNPGGYSHTSVALADTIKAISIPVVEVHLSNIFARESYRQQSLTGAASAGSISGFGMEGYRLALQFLIRKNQQDQGR
ncbi:MAG: 3-dehydroquinate dehydratase [Bacteroidales bacterium]|nr:3-dehydroquinate dehydratase [Bacteroidales bacterium]